MEFIESPRFSKLVYDYLTEDEYLGLQSTLLRFPEAGDLVPGSGGVRKIRWAMSTRGSGKRGGARIIYYYRCSESEIWLLTIYGKNETSNIPAHLLRKIAQEIQDV